MATKIQPMLDRMQKTLVREFARMLDESKTVAIVPEYDTEGNIVGGTAVQQNGERRSVALPKQAKGV